MFFMVDGNAFQSTEVLSCLDPFFCIFFFLICDEKLIFLEEILNSFLCHVLSWYGFSFAKIARCQSSLPNPQPKLKLLTLIMKACFLSHFLVMKLKPLPQSYNSVLFSFVFLI